MRGSPQDGGRRRRTALAVLCAADVLVTLDGTVVAVALPAIQSGLGFSATALQWVVTGYTVALGAFVLLGGRIADTRGPRRTLIAGLCVFAAGSLLAGLAPAAAVLAGARAVAGLGAALAIPSALALITATFPEGARRTRALGVVSAGMDVALVAGAVLGGVVVAALGWRWVFFFAVPLAVATAVLAPAVLAEHRPPDRPERLSPASALTAAGGLALAILALTRAESRGPGATATLAPLGGAAMLLAVLVAVERRAPAPLLHPTLLRRRQALAACLAVVANAGAFGGVLVLSTLVMQRALGLSPLHAGLAFVPLGLSAGAGGPAAPRLVDRFGTCRVVAASFAVTAAAVAWIAHAPDAPYAVALLPAFAVSGFTFATAAVPLTAEAVAGAGPAEEGAAAGLFQTCTHAGGAAVLAALVVAAGAWSDHVAADGERGAAALVAGYRFAFALTAMLLLAGAAVTAVLLRERRG